MNGPGARIELTKELLKLFVERDMDPWDVEELHADVRAAMKLAPTCPASFI